MILDADNNKKYPDKVEYINRKKAQRDIPDFFIPWSLGKGKDAKADVCLFETGACPDNLNRIAVWIAQYVGWQQGYLCAEKVQDRCYYQCHMMRHPVKRG